MMGHLQLSTSGFSLRSGVREDGDKYATCIQPDDAALKRKGALALLMEPAGDHPSLANDACHLAESVINQQFFSDTSVSLTTSLLGAIEAANRAVLEHDYERQTSQTNDNSENVIAVQGGGVRTRGAKVGVTAALFRPDGGGVYLAQLAPTQAYLVHNGSVQALPEPPGWSQSAEDELWANDEDEETPAKSPIPFPGATLPAQSLGSKPGIVVDLIYRRVEPGDLLVLVSPALARCLDRNSAESIFLSGDPASVCEALYEVAQQYGLARASASVIGIGGAEQAGTNAGLDTRYEAPEIVTQRSGGALDALKARMPVFRVATTYQRESAASNGADETESANEEETPVVLLHREQQFTDLEATPAEDEEQEGETEGLEEAQHPTATLLQRTLDVPPYRQPTLLFAQGSEEVGQGEATQFDGWEDLPPTLITTKYPVLERVPTGTEGRQVAAQAYLGEASSAAPVYAQTRIYNIQRTPAPPPPRLEFGDEFLDEAVSMNAHADPIQIGRARTFRPKLSLPQISRPQIKAPRIHLTQAQIERGKAVLGGGARWGASTLRSLLPEKVASARSAGAYGSKRMVVPRRTIIAGAIILVLVVLVFSVLSGGSKANQQATVNYLQDAKQEDLLANQPGITDTERQTHLTLALEKAQKALLADPQSAEAKRLVTKEQSALDKAQGVTRLKEPKLLFDLGKIATQGNITATTAVTGTFALSDMVIQSDDAYLFDKAAGRIYRCKIAAQTCAPVLSSGDTAGGEKAGNLIAMTMRVGSLVAVDDKLVSYVYNADNSAWQAQPLGDAANLQKPKDVATYDGNLYLLDSKPGQISKYASGAYGAAPADWLQDPASLEQVKNPVSLAIDGVIYVLLGDGKVLAMQGGKIVKTIVPTTADAAPASDLFTSTDASDIYLLRADGTITRVSKEGQTVANLKPSVSQDDASALSGIAVDEGRGKLYLLRGQYVYEAILPGRVVQPPADGSTDQPVVKPTVEP